MISNCCRMMNKVICLFVALFASGMLYAQQGSPYYTVKDSKATYEPHGKRTFYPMDSIKVKKKSVVILTYHDSRSKMDGQIRVVDLNEAGTFAIKDYYSRGKPQIGAGTEKDGLTPAAATSGSKADEALTASVVTGIGEFLVHPDRPIFGCGAISAKRGKGAVTVVNQGENELFFDIIWIQDGRCLSAQSFAKDFLSGYCLAPGETCHMKIDPIAEKQTLYLVGTPDPVQYNRIDLTKYNDLSAPPSGTYSLSIVKVEE